MTYIFSKDQFKAFQEAFCARAASKSITATDIIMYNAIRGKNLNRGFTPITNANKLANGATPNFAYDSAKENAQYRLRIHERYPTSFTVFGTQITPEQREIFQQALKGE